MKTLTAERSYADVKSVAEKIMNGDPATISIMDPGDVVRQGDVYLIALDVEPKMASPFVGRQLAPGTTQGSRHVAEGDCKLYVPDEENAVAILNRLIPTTRDEQQFLGPVIKATGPVTITHPEHGHRTLPPGTYLTTYQRTGREVMRRAED